jgi:hypothetical protein
MNELERIRKEAVLARLAVSSRYLTEENQKKKPPSVWIFEIRTVVIMKY